MKNLLPIAGLILVAALSRFFPHPWNWTAVGATALLCGARLGSLRVALFVPLAAMILTDALIGFHRHVGYVYGAIALTVLAAFVLRTHIRGWRVGAAALGSSVLFFLVTNFGVWFDGGMYPPTFEGLIACYAAAVPFFGNQAVGDLVYASLFFFAWDHLEARFPAFSKISSR